jgi:hypothetical protein
MVRRELFWLSDGAWAALDLMCFTVSLASHGWMIGG